MWNRRPAGQDTRAARASRRADGADADRHDRTRAGLRGTRRVRRAHRGHASQDQPLFGHDRGRRGLQLERAVACAARAPRHGGADPRPRQPRGADRAGRARGGQALAARAPSQAAHPVDRPPHRPLQGHRHARRGRRTLRLQVAAGHAPRRPHAHGDRVGGDAGPRASVHRGRGLLPGAQRLAVEPERHPPQARAARHRTSTPTTTPRPPAAFSNGACARATSWRRPCRRASRSSTASTPS